MFPTKSKDKIPKDFSYPTNASLLSEALADVPQASQLGIYFGFDRTANALRKNAKPYPVIKITYYRGEQSGFSRTNINSEPQWQISVEAVPREIVHRVKELIQTQALPEMRVWCGKKSKVVDEQGYHCLRFFYDELRDELKSESKT